MKVVIMQKEYNMSLYNTKNRNTKTNTLVLGSGIKAEDIEIKEKTAI